MKAATIFALALLAAASAGCASIDSQQDTDGSRTGIRYYNSAPFILAYSDGKGGVVAELVYLPDTTRVMSLDATAFFAQNKTVMTFDKSILNNSETTVDATEVPKAVLEAAKTIATAQIASSANIPDNVVQNELPAPYIFRIHYGKDADNPDVRSWQLVGGQANLPIKSTFVRTGE